METWKHEKLSCLVKIFSQEKSFRESSEIVLKYVNLPKSLIHCVNKSQISTSKPRKIWNPHEIK